MMISGKDDLLICRREELVPENPPVTKTGIVGLLEFRLNMVKPPECLFLKYDETIHGFSGRSKTAEYIEELFGTDPFETGTCEIIFDAWSYLSGFFRGMSKDRRDDERYVLSSLDYIFDGYEEIRPKLDKLADYQYCLANMMPAPVGFRQNRFTDGKGNPDRDNGLPDIYYKRAKAEFPQMYDWINEHTEALSLQIFSEYESFCEDGHANEAVTDDPVELIPFERRVDNAIACIEWRAMKIYNRYVSRYKRK